MRKPVLWWLLVIIIILPLFNIVIKNQQRFTKKFDFDYFSNLYSNSQYVVGSGSEGIGDDGLYAFAGYYYLVQGGDPSQVNFEHPPLGKYFVGLSVVVFNNENVINIIYLILILITTYQIGKIIIKNDTLSLIPPLLISIELHFQDHLIRSFIDLPFTLFFILGVYFFIKALENEKLFYASALFWGMAFSTKFFPAIIFFYLLFLIIVKIYAKTKLKPFLISSFLIPIIYISSHVMYFANNHSFIEFLRHKKWMVDWWSGSPIVPFNILRNILTGWYQDSYGGARFSEFWTPIIPAVVILAITRLQKNIFNKSNLAVLVIYLTCIIYLIFLTFLNGGVLKFIMPIYPLLCILAVNNIDKIIRRNAVAAIKGIVI
ncbi:glycosyltransferase family 39 protein [Candidatus Gottesmanbacteria bacterium]|nr:glycosyltransferase family 39 protein [Candidatus Gottesmanbacteria bacterium]